MKAVTVVIEGGERRLVLSDVAEPAPGDGEVLVAVKAVSLNHGEVAGSLREAEAGHRPGWDFAGVVEQAPAGSGFAAGERVFGLLFEGAWAERVAVPLGQVAPIPDGVGFAAAATLPIAGLTAAVALGKKPLPAGGRVLVTAATGGVGTFAIQLAAAAGAHVTALSRNPANAGFLRDLGAADVATGADDLAALDRFDLIVDGVGGRLLGALLDRLNTRGVCVLLGDAAGAQETRFDARHFRLGDGGLEGGKTLYGFFLLEELTRPDPTAAPPLLADLAARVAAGGLRTLVERTGSWRDVDGTARALLAGEFRGKAVLLVE